MAFAQRTPKRIGKADSQGTPQAYNRYTYVLNNPAKYVDPTGQRLEEGAGYYYEPARPQPSRWQRFTQPVVDVYKDRAPRAGGAVITKYSASIVTVERQLGIPQGRLGAVIRHESSDPLNVLDVPLALLGRDQTTVGIGQMSLETAEMLESETEPGLQLGYSQDYEARVWRLNDPEEAIRYSGKYLMHLYRKLAVDAPEGTSNRLVWDVTTVAYNVGPEAMSQSIAENSFGVFGPRGREYYLQVVPYVPEVALQLY